MNKVDNGDIRAKILENIYVRKQKGMEILTSPSQYADLLAISKDLASFNIQYLIDSGLLYGEHAGSLGTTRKELIVSDITRFGVDAVEGRSGQNLAVNYKIININAPITQSQVAVGEKISQEQQINVCTLDDLEHYLDSNFESREVSELKSELQELKRQIESDRIRPTTLSKLKDLAAKLGPTAAIIVLEAIKKVLGL